MKAPLVLSQVLEGRQVLLADVAPEEPEPLVDGLDVELHGQLLAEGPLAELALEVL